MGGNGTVLTVSRRGFFTATACSVAALKWGTGCNGDGGSSVQPDARIRDASVAPDAGQVTPPDGGSPAAGLQNGESITMQFNPAPSDIHIDGDRVWVPSSQTDDDWYPSQTCGLFRFRLATRSVDDSVEFSRQFLGSVAALPDGSPVVGKRNGFYHRDVTYEFPSDLRGGDMLLPGGLLLTENDLGGHNLWFSASRFDYVRYNNQEDPYLAQMLLAYPINSNNIDVDGMRQISTSGKNPTSLGLGPDGRLYVLNSGTYSWFGQPQPSIDIVDAARAQFIESRPITSLQGVTLQVSARLAIDSENFAYVGTADESRRVFKVDLDTCEVVKEGTAAAKGFHASVVLGGGYVFATSRNNNNALVSIFDTESLALVDVVDLGRKQLGPAVSYLQGSLQTAPEWIISIQPNEG